jgi:hypothetical protein
MVPKVINLSVPIKHVYVLWILTMRITLRITGFSDFVYRPVFMGPSEGTNLSHWTSDPLSHLGTETDPVSEMLYFLVSTIPADGQSPKTKRI